MLKNYSYTTLLTLCYWIFLSLSISINSCLHSQELPKISKEDFADGITVDLREPLYEDGILTTEKGGVITGPNIRIQALNIRYTRKLIDGKPRFTIEAEGQLSITFGEYVFVGQKLFYDFQTKEGTIAQGRTNSGPWYFGGEKIDLRPDGSYLIYNGYVTTSENIDPEWELFTKEIAIYQDHRIEAKDVKFKIYRYSILWIPSLKLNLDSIFDSPIRYRFKWGGGQGPRFGFTYELFSWERWKTFVRLDYRLTRGPGGGIETYYLSEDHLTEFQSINYIAKDSATISPHEKSRYRFEGVFRKSMDCNKTTILLTYDKISDLDMPSSYYDRDFDFETSKRTQLLVRRQEENWIANFYARVRVNNFQTVKQELPSLSVNFRPYSLGNTGWIFEHQAKAAYLDFKYANNIADVKNYSSTRLDYRPRIYRPFILGPLTLTPEAQAVAICYGNSPEEESQWLAVGILGGEARTQFYRYYQEDSKHVIEPYASYRYYSHPTIPVHQHYIFDIEDAWVYLNQFTFGVQNALYQKRANCCIFRPIVADIYAHAFIDNDHIHPIIPKLYGRLVFFTVPTLRHTIETAWDFRHRQLGHINIRMDWTINADLAFSMEYRHRNAYTWRKADQNNFFLEAFYPEKVLRHSPLSDRRDTLLLYGFYRFHPDWAFAIASRNGWNRERERSYSEYEIDLLTTIQTAWHLKFSFQHQEDDTRFAVYMNIGLKQPTPCEPTDMCWYYE